MLSELALERFHWHRNDTKRFRQLYTSFPSNDKKQLLQKPWNSTKVSIPILFLLTSWLIWLDDSYILSTLSASVVSSLYVYWKREAYQWVFSIYTDCRLFVCDCRILVPCFPEWPRYRDTWYTHFSCYALDMSLTLLLGPRFHCGEVKRPWCIICGA